MHREENVDSVQNLKFMVDSLNALAQSYEVPVIVSTHPRTQNMIDNSMSLRLTNEAISETLGSMTIFASRSAHSVLFLIAAQLLKRLMLNFLCHNQKRTRDRKGWMLER